MKITSSWVLRSIMALHSLPRWSAWFDLLICLFVLLGLFLLFNFLFASSYEQITDLSLSRKTQSDFKNFLETHQGENADPSIDMAVTILTSGVWPSLKSSSLHLPSEMVIMIFLNFQPIQKLKLIFLLHRLRVPSFLRNFTTRRTTRRS